MAEVPHVKDAQNFVSGVLTAATDALTMNRFLTWGGVSFQLKGTGWTGTVTFEGTVNGSDWVAMQVTPIGSTTGVTTATTDGIWWVQTNGFAGVRARCSAFTAGTMAVAINRAPSQV